MKRESYDCLTIAEQPLWPPLGCKKRQFKMVNNICSFFSGFAKGSHQLKKKNGILWIKFTNGLLWAFDCLFKVQGGLSRLCESSFHPKNFVFFTSKIVHKKIEIGIHKSGTPRGGQRFMNFIHKIPFFFNRWFP